MPNRFDVLICGGGLAGLTLAKQLAREFPELTAALVEKTRRPLPEGSHKVGESSVELGSQYLERLGLRAYLHERHLIKFGLRFFPGGGHLPIESRVEIGPIHQPVVNSYQIDRGRFESDLREMVAAEPTLRLIEGASVKDIHLSPAEEDHKVWIETASGIEQYTARWVVDATGRAALLRARLKLKRGGNHEANAGWFRVRGHLDLSTMAPATANRWHSVPESSQRWLSTNHLMGPGYWVWVIPLSSGMTSIGVVTHNEFHNFDEVRSIERLLTFLQRHEPAFADFIAGSEIMDFGCLRKYCNTISRCWHPDRWAIVGEAGAFTDPLYSPGTDYIALANSFTTELIRVDLGSAEDAGILLRRSQELNAQYRALVSGSIAVYRSSAEVYGHPRAMASKIYWDNHVYWSFPCQFFQQNIYRLSGPDLVPFTEVGARFVELSNRMQQVLKFWAKVDNFWEASDRVERPSEGRRSSSSESAHGDPNAGARPPDREGDMLVLPGFPSMLVDAHCALERSMTPDQTLTFMRNQLDLAEVLFAELLFRVLLEVGEEQARRLWIELGAHEWGVALPADRVQAEAFHGRTRKRALPSVARDVERALGLPQFRWRPQEAAEWLKAPAAEVA